MPNYYEYQIDTLLTRLSKGYVQNDLIADRLFPRFDVDKKRGIYYVFGKEGFRIEKDLRTGLARANRVRNTMTKANYGPLLEHSLEYGIDQDELDELGADMAREIGTNTVTSKINLNHEKAVADMLSDTAIITQNVTLSGTDQWSDFTNSDPVDDVNVGRDLIMATGIGKRPNVLAMGYQVWTKLRYHTKLLNALGNGERKLGLTSQQLADFFEVDQVIVGESMYDTAKEGQTPSLSYVWGKNAWLMYVNNNQNPTVADVSAGYTLQLRGARYVDRWKEIGVKGEFVRANDYYQPFLVAAEAVYLIKNAVA